MPDTRMESWVHDDAQDNQLVIATYADVGAGPAVVFDGGAFTDPVRLGDYITSLQMAARWLAQEATR